MSTTEPAGSPPAGADRPDLKACCAAAYENDVVALLLGPSYHPGGPELSRRLARALALRPGDRVLDVASGPGTTAALLAREFEVDVEGVDLGPWAVQNARRAAADAGLAHAVRFRVGDAERLPYRAGDVEGGFDAVVCECALCTFPDKPAAVAEFARVLAPGGRVGITDVTVVPGGLGAELRSLAGWVACLADARPLEEYAALLAGAGLTVTHTERHDDALAQMIDGIDARLAALRIARLPALAGLDWARVDHLLRLARQAVDDGAIGYALLVARTWA